MSNLYRHADKIGTAAVFGGLFLFFAALGGLEERNSLAMFWMYFAAFISFIVFLFATIVFLVSIYTSERGPHPGRGIDLEHESTPCNARG
jgi:hypothetical protein